MNEWNRKPEDNTKLMFNNKEGQLKIDCINNEYFIQIRNTKFAATTSYIQLTKEEFNHIAQEIYKLWEPSNIIEALDRIK